MGACACPVNKFGSIMRVVFILLVAALFEAAHSAVPEFEESDEFDAFDANPDLELEQADYRMTAEAANKVEQMEELALRNKQRSELSTKKATAEKQKKQLHKIRKVHAAVLKKAVKESKTKASKKVHVAPKVVKKVHTVKAISKKVVVKPRIMDASRKPAVKCPLTRKEKKMHVYCACPGTGKPCPRKSKAFKHHGKTCYKSLCHCKECALPKSKTKVKPPPVKPPVKEMSKKVVVKPRIMDASRKPHGYVERKAKKLKQKVEINGHPNSVIHHQGYKITKDKSDLKKTKLKAKDTSSHHIGYKLANPIKDDSYGCCCSRKCEQLRDAKSCKSDKTCSWASNLPFVDYPKH